MFKTMNKGIALAVFSFLFMTAGAFATETNDTPTKKGKSPANEAVVKYSMEFKSDDPQMKQQLFMMDNSTMTMAFKGQKLYTETKIGAIQNSTSVIDKDADKMVILMSGMMGKKATQKEGLKDEEEDNTDEVNFEKTDETKEILGYKCIKYTGEDEEGNTSIYWVTEDIVPEVQSKNFAGGIKGLPLEFEIIQPQMNITFTATELNTDVSKKDEKKYFSTEIPEGYDVVPYEEFTKMGGGGM